MNCPNQKSILKDRHSPRTAVLTTWQKTRTLQQDLCYVRQDDQAEGTQLYEEPNFSGIRMGKLLPGERTRQFQEMAHLPELQCPGERSCLCRMWWKWGLSGKMQHSGGGRWGWDDGDPFPRESVWWAGPPGRLACENRFLGLTWIHSESKSLESGQGMNRVPKQGLMILMKMVCQPREIAAHV